ncbi:hypothetical protein H311_03876 [Anncaliia algerae PRA109]|nr:hypothetical protein H311_03876 [Anncaliia algerae PRA109]
MKWITSLEELTKIKNYLTQGILLHEITGSSKRWFINRAKNILVEGEKLFLNDMNKKKLIIADNDHVNIKKTLENIHLPGHIGVKAMYKAVLEEYCGFKSSNIDEFVKRCKNCQHYMPLKRIDPIKPIKAEFPWERIQIDLVDMRRYSTENKGYS